jgi:4-oxalocrotonate tautomerase
MRWPEMLVLKLTMLEGRTEEQKLELYRRLTEASKLLGENPAEVRLLLTEMKKTHWVVGGKPMGSS